MAKIVSKEQHTKMLIKCKSGKHKFRTNTFGVTWCVICGLLAHNANAPLLTDNAKIIINNN